VVENAGIWVCGCGPLQRDGLGDVRLLRVMGLLRLSSQGSVEGRHVFGHVLGLKLSFRGAQQIAGAGAVVGAVTMRWSPHEP
jgi:hypothetical protein